MLSRALRQLQTQGLPVRTRLLLLTGVLMALLALSALAGVGLLYNAQQTFKTVLDDRVVPLRQLKTVSDAFAVTAVDQIHKARDGAVPMSQAYLEIDRALVAARSNWQAYLATYMTPREQELLQVVQRRWPAAQRVVQRAQVLLASSDRAALAELAAVDLYPAVDPLSDALERLSDLQETVTVAAFAASETRFHQALMGAGAVLVLALGFASWFALHTVRAITQPLQQALQAAQAVAAGRLQTPIATAQARRDEIGQLLRAVDTMRGSLVEQLDHDMLTGLYSRRRFADLLRFESLRAARMGGTWSVLMIDLDHFKRVNDTYGHAGGDAALAAVGSAIRVPLRSLDAPARLGGEELAVLMPGCDAASAAVVAERLRQAIAHIAVPHNGGVFHLTASLGVAQWQPSDTDGQAVVNRADQALYAAKNSGRNRVVVANASSAVAADQAAPAPATVSTAFALEVRGTEQATA
jgi:diguanylate cyclase (GGDEF)-like protein